MTQQSEEAAAQFVIPDFDFVIVASRDNQGIMEVKIHAADGTVVFFEAVYDGADAVIPSKRGGGGACVNNFNS